MLALAGLLALPGGASALDKYQYGVVLLPASGTDSGTAASVVEITHLDIAKTVRIRFLRAGSPLPYTTDLPAGNAQATASTPLIASGDVIEVQQPTGTVQETFTIPDVSLSGAAGSANLTGHAPDGAFTFASFEPTCFARSTLDKDIPVSPKGGAFSVTYPKAMGAGQELTLTAFPGKGDSVLFRDRVPGETPCLEAYAIDYPKDPGSPPDPTPYGIRADNMRATIGPNARILLRRAGAIVADYSGALQSGGLYTEMAAKPQAGDVIEVYRPQGAPAPSATFTLPAVSAVYDPSNSLVAVDAPPANLLSVIAAKRFQMFGMRRSVIDGPAGRNVFNFAIPEGGRPALDLSNIDYILADWSSNDLRGRFEISVGRGDLAAPVIGVKLASKFKLAKLGSSIPVTVTTNEPVAASLALTLPAKLKTSKSKKAKKPTIIASAKVSLVAGKKKVKLKLTKAGKKLIKRIRSQHLPSQKATLTVIAKDPSGNSATKLKTTKLVSK
jgi:hypothetical protein